MVLVRHVEGVARRNVLLRGAVITTAAVVLGNLMGLARDLMIAEFFGANGDTDAFLVAWTLPETAVPLLMDSAMALLMVPIFTRALQTAEHEASAIDPVRTLVAATLPKLVLWLAALSGLIALTAPWLVRILAPGLADVTLGVAAVRMIAASVLFIGIAGYFAAGLRAHLVYGPPAMVTVAMNIGIITLLVAFHQKLGVLAAVLGVTVGSALMVAVQLPAFVRRIGLPRRIGTDAKVRITTFLPILAYLLTRQAQTYVGRFVASWLAAGTITQLNYGQKIAQVPSTLALILAVVSFPQLARSIAAGNETEARQRLALNVRIIGAIVLAATAYLFAFAPQVVALLLQHGAFTAADTSATAGLTRIYIWGLLGQVLLDTCCRSLYSERATLVPFAAVAVGLVVTTVVAIFGAAVWGALAIAGANAIGVSVAAVMMVASRRSRLIPAQDISLIILRLLPATACATAFAVWLAMVLAGLPDVVVVGVGALSVAVVFGLVALATRALPLPRFLPLIGRRVR